VHTFTIKKIDKPTLLGKSIILTHKELAAATAPPLMDQKDLGKAQMSPSTAKLSKKQPRAREPRMDGTQIMTRVSQRDTGRDYIFSTSWERVEKQGGKHTMKTIEKRKKFYGKKNIASKSILRYLSPPDKYGLSVLTWNYIDGHKAFWSRPSRQFTAVRIPTMDYLRTPAEADFRFTDYFDFKISDEKHVLLANEIFEGKQCYLVESVPKTERPEYAKRRSWIDQQYFIPLKIEYANAEGDYWKTLAMAWDQKFGIWFWKSLLVENILNGAKTFITVKDVRINVGFMDQEFTLHALESKMY
jgi:hypothetical protein